MSSFFILGVRLRSSRPVRVRKRRDAFDVFGKSSLPLGFLVPKKSLQIYHRRGFSYKAAGKVDPASRFSNIHLYSGAGGGKSQNKLYKRVYMWKISRQCYTK